MAKYPALNISSKNILYKRLSGNREDEIQKNKELIEYCTEHFDELWRDNSSLKPEKNKWVRDCTGSRLSRLLSKVDRLLLKPFDKFLPNFIHGGISGKFQKKSGAIIPKCTQSAAVSLIDSKKGRWLLHMDLQRFFEQVSKERVMTLFYSKFRCDKAVSHLLANFCCVYEGSKQSPNKEKDKVIARGFSPSVRLAIWCNLEFFLALNQLVQKELKEHYPKLAVFVDDIGITAINIDKKKLEVIRDKICALAQNHHLIINTTKTHIISPQEVKEYVGVHLTNHKIFPSLATTQKRYARIGELKKAVYPKKEKIKQSLTGLNNHRKFTKEISLL